ncbi:M56 family metallopeptidase [Streptantibioticus ferralitis]|uniref:M56 family metallopeptidase n=1 Tax=Streptantibioticus ferralitis TaxID=236510 RepID=A0ABT5YX86_9ACTN|nr:M56 family metallopeptidase [Streptantibioticus ferralitis]MDF2256169.1 M56 family metallopeptidase [Streptantibioticus ferralitis]
MGTAFALPLVGVAFAMVAPRILARARWQDREPVVALWVWQCVVAAVLLCFGLSLLVTAAALWAPLRDRLFWIAPRGVQDSYDLTVGGAWRGVFAAVLVTAAIHLVLHLVREAHLARISRRRRYHELREAAPPLPYEQPHRWRIRRDERLLVMESPRPQAWSLPLPRKPLQLVVSTGAMRRLSREQLDAVLAHERAHARARHHLLLQSAGALATAFPGATLFTAYADRSARLVELAADDAAAYRHGHLATALALLDLNETRLGTARPVPAVWAPGTPPPPPVEQVAARVDRLLTGPPRLRPVQRLNLTAVGLMMIMVPVLVALAPGLDTLLTVGWRG